MLYIIDSITGASVCSDVPFYTKIMPTKLLVILTCSDTTHCCFMAYSEDFVLYCIVLYYIVLYCIGATDLKLCQLTWPVARDMYNEEMIGLWVCRFNRMGDVLRSLFRTVWNIMLFKLIILIFQEALTRRRTNLKVLMKSQRCWWRWLLLVWCAMFLSQYDVCWSS